MSITYENANGAVCSMHRRAVAKTAFNGPKLEGEESVDSGEYAARMIFQNDDGVKAHAIDLAKALAKDYKLSAEQMNGLTGHMGDVVDCMPAEIKQFNRIGTMNKYLQREIVEYLKSIER